MRRLLCAAGNLLEGLQPCQWCGRRAGCQLHQPEASLILSQPPLDIGRALALRPEILQLAGALWPLPLTDFWLRIARGGVADQAITEDYPDKGGISAIGGAEVGKIGGGQHQELPLLVVGVKSAGEAGGECQLFPWGSRLHGLQQTSKAIDVAGAERAWQPLHVDGIDAAGRSQRCDEL